VPRPNFSVRFIVSSKAPQVVVGKEEVWRWADVHVGKVFDKLSLHVEAVLVPFLRVDSPKRCLQRSIYLWTAIFHEVSRLLGSGPAMLGRNVISAELPVVTPVKPSLPREALHNQAELIWRPPS
jgi:hypothetical protein